MSRPGIATGRQRMHERTGATRGAARRHQPARWFEAISAGLAATALLVAAYAWANAAHPEPARGNGGIGAAFSRLFAQVRRADPAAPDIQAAVYGGYSATNDSDIVLRQPNGTDMTMKSVRWLSAPGKMPPYHGFRGTWWLPFGRSLGGMVDLVYVKVIADRERPVRQSGTRDGAPVPDTEPLSSTFRRLEFTDGLNLLTGNITYRLPFLGRVRPYVGVGVGASLPHAEVRRAGAAARTFSFQLAGWVVQAYAGIEFQIAPRGSVFGEYRASYATNAVRLVDGGSLKTNLLVNHASAGVTGHLRPSLSAGAR